MLAYLDARALLPWSWHWHPAALLLLVLIAGGYAKIVRLCLRFTGRLDRPVIRRSQIARFAGGFALLLAALDWPLQDLSQRWSLLARMVQQVVLLLVIPPLFLRAVPRWFYNHSSSHPKVDFVFKILSRPWIATVIFSSAAIGSLMPAAVEAQASSDQIHLLVDCCLLLAGMIMWLPPLRLLPGASGLSTAGRIGYLFFQSLVPNFPAIIFIFARHPLYQVYAAHSAQLGLPSLADQQLAGALAKIASIGILWGTAARIWVVGERNTNAGRDPDPWTWDDVQHELRRADRRPT